MGRQHTTWISDETWDRLQNIEGDSVSKRIANAVKQADPDREMVINAEMRRLARLVKAMKNINALLVRDNIDDLMGTIVKIELIVDEVEFCWRD
jgi:2-oxo-4-hydroxy-4-carboxy--5-ureidoimidazoline (OHCU) decarboxylase